MEIRACKPEASHLGVVLIAVLELDRLKALDAPVDAKK
jgi:hypothetical protein